MHDQYNECYIGSDLTKVSTAPRKASLSIPRPVLAESVLTIIGFRTTWSRKGPAYSCRSAARREGAAGSESRTNRRPVRVSKKCNLYTEVLKATNASSLYFQLLILVKSNIASRAYRPDNFLIIFLSENTTPYTSFASSSNGKVRDEGIGGSPTGVVLRSSSLTATTSPVVLCENRWEGGSVEA